MNCRTQKVSFPSLSAAMGAKRRLNKRKGILLHAYQCPDCKRWHLGNTRGTKLANIDRIFEKLAISKGPPDAPT